MQRTTNESLGFSLNSLTDLKLPRTLLTKFWNRVHNIWTFQSKTFHLSAMITGFYWGTHRYLSTNRRVFLTIEYSRFYKALKMLRRKKTPCIMESEPMGLTVFIKNRLKSTKNCRKSHNLNWATSLSRRNCQKPWDMLKSIRQNLLIGVYI